MKRIIGLTLAFAIAGFSLAAQQTREVKPHQPGQKMQQGQHKQMMKDVNLSDAQKATIKANHEAGKAKMEALNKEEDITVREMKTRRTAIQQEQKAKMEAVFTPEQKATMTANKAAMETKRAANMEKHMAITKEKLGLTDDQAAKLKKHSEDTHNKMKAIQDNQSLTMDQKKQQLKTVREAAFNERKTILTAEQLKKMQEMKKEGNPKKDQKGKKEDKGKK